jgi:hypothetical protein
MGRQVLTLVATRCRPRSHILHSTGKSSQRLLTLASLTKTLKETLPVCQSTSKTFSEISKELLSIGGRLSRASTAQASTSAALLRWARSVMTKVASVICNLGSCISNKKTKSCIPLQKVRRTNLTTRPIVLR